MMSRKIFVNHSCPFCNGHVPEYAPDNDSEWLFTKRGLKQYFHTSCYAKMVERNKKEVVKQQ